MLAFLCALVLQPGLQLPSIFSDNMVLQREASVPFFGTARPGSPVRVTIGERFVETKAKPDGTWTASFRPMPAGGPYSVTITSDRTVTLRNVMVGEVWVASGQSNMEWRQADSDDLAQAIQEANNTVRMFTVPRVSAERPIADAKANWIVGSPETVENFSAVANAFAKVLNKSLGVTVGIIHTSWGGTPAEAWTSRTAMLAHPNLAPIVNNYLAGLEGFQERKAAYDQAIAEWGAKVYKTDTGNQGFLRGYADFGANISDWRNVMLPNLIEVTEQQEMDGAVWYRKMVDLPDTWHGQAVTLELGPIDDYDDTYVNGRKVGRTDSSVPWAHAVSRRYRIAPGILRRGQNVIAVRVFDGHGRGGFTGSPGQMRWYPEGKQAEAINLAGDWLSKIELKYDPPTPELMRSQP
jgi:sialate O-acetylesterase